VVLKSRYLKSPLVEPSRKTKMKKIRKK